MGISACEYRYGVFMVRRMPRRVRKVRLKKLKSVGACVLGFALAFSSGGMKAAAAENTVNVQVDLEFGQAEAQTIKDMVNTLRTTDAWQYDENNNKVDVPNLGTLVYDAKLEEIAMQRAAELALYYSHTRANGEGCDTAFKDLGYSGWTFGENIAAGYVSAADVFKGWCEDGADDNYSTQGHRRNMLNGNFTAIGMGHVVYNGTHYWAMELGVSDVESNTGVDGAKTVPVEVNYSNIQSLSAGKDSCTAAVGSASELPEVKATITQSSSVNWVSPATCTVINPEWIVADPSVATVADGKVTGQKAGSTTLTVSAGGASVTVALEVTADGQGSDGDNSGGNTGDGDNSGGNTGDGDNSGGNTGDGDNSGGNTGDGDNSGGNTGDGDNSGGNTGDGDNSGNGDSNEGDNNGGNGGNDSGSSSDGGSSDDGKKESSSGSSVSKDEPVVVKIPTTSVVGGVATTTEGVYFASSVNGSIITTGVADIAKGYGLTDKEKPYAKFYNLDPKKSALAKASIDAAAAEQKAAVGSMLNIELGKMSSGKYTLLPSDGPAVRIVLGIPKGFAENGKTYAVVCVREGGAYTVCKDLDSVAGTVTFETTGGAGVYAIIKY